MPRTLTFKIKKKEYEVVPTKIDRKKLYGWTEILALDESGNDCKLVYTDETGTLVIPKGGTSLGIFSHDGEWIDRSTLQVIKLDGTPAEIYSSSYNIIISLNDKVTEEEFLDYSITDFYQLDASDELRRAIGKNIYTFRYTYLDSYETIPAFIMVSGNILYMLLGYENKFEMLCLGDCEVVDEEDDFIQVEETDIDFSMF